MYRHAFSVLHTLSSELLSSEGIVIDALLAVVSQYWDNLMLEANQ